MRKITSVGLVINTNRARAMDRAGRERFFLETLRRAPYLDRLLASADYLKGSFCERPDYSYYSTTLCGENFYCIGDAASFVDPIYSHGVLNAFYNAAMTALAVCESLKRSGTARTPCSALREPHQAVLRVFPFTGAR